MMAEEEGVVELDMTRDQGTLAILENDVWDSKGTLVYGFGLIELRGPLVYLRLVVYFVLLWMCFFLLFVGLAELIRLLEKIKFPPDDY
jgi:hypothetical protein